ncbi:MAG: amidinotransferase [Cyclobacteriaceae bacterium]|nr:amidinotransferase [Cyclobacteriaceae bacterium]
MVRPANFGFNPLTAASNTFQHPEDEAPELIQSRARLEFDLFVEKLIGSDIDVIVLEDTPDPITPDAIFPNNWISFHEDGTVVLYPMMAENRRLERREEVIYMLEKNYRFTVSRILDLTFFEQFDRFLEGTGSMVLDYVNRKAFSNLSPRTEESVLDRFCQEMNFRKEVFSFVDENGMEIYHANVVMCIGTGYVVVCLESIIDEAERIKLLHSFEASEHEIIEISYLQLSGFAGNMIELKNGKDDPFLVMSEKAYRSLGKDQEKRLGRHADILFSPLDTIEKYGGGSARCMIAGIFLPRK